MDDSQASETTSRLRQLDELPEVPIENLAVPEVGQIRHLSISREKEIASNLAFLSAASDESFKVMAVCVEEHYNGEGITIRVASNTGDLSAVIREFMTLTKVLEQATRRGHISTKFRSLTDLPFREFESRGHRGSFRQVVALDLPAETVQAHEVVREIVKQAHEFP